MRTMAQSAVEYDEVMRVLLECELKLKVLQQEGRLTLEGLREFVELSTKVRAELDRRQLPDRRRMIRASPDRRSVAGLTRQPSIEPA
jgi:hypothetical protein